MHFDTTITVKKKEGNKGKIPGMIMMVFGLATVIWFIVDILLITAGIRTVYLENLASTSRLIIGIIGILGGIVVWKWDDIDSFRT